LYEAWEHPDHGIHPTTVIAYLAALPASDFLFDPILGSIDWDDLPCDRRIILCLRDEEDRDHMTAVINGVLKDTFDCRGWEIRGRLEEAPKPKAPS
jgi:hypothetical protein